MAPRTKVEFVNAVQKVLGTLNGKRMSYSAIEAKMGLPAGTVRTVRKNPEAVNRDTLRSIWYASKELVR